MTTPHTDDQAVTAARHALVEQLAHTAAGRGLAPAILDQLHAELVAGIVLLRTAAAGDPGARRYAIEQLEAARDCLDDAAAAYEPSGLPPMPRQGGTLTERLARAQLDPEVSTVRTPDWRAELCGCGHRFGLHNASAGGCTGRQQLMPGSWESCICTVTERDGVQL